MSSLFRSIKAIAILDHDGNRIISKYYDATYPTLRNTIRCYYLIVVFVILVAERCTLENS